jgi:TPR repeat protein
MAAQLAQRTMRERLAACAAMFVPVLFLTACPMQDPYSATSVLPRFTKLDLFDPHRQSFECSHEADVNPVPTAHAETLFQQGMAATSYDLWPDDRDYKTAGQLWTQAAGQNHWKAQLNLAGLYLQGFGVPQDVAKALELTEDLMRKGVPAAWDNMGAYYMGGIGPLKQDATVAYAFWQKAADMGSMAAQAYLGEKLLGTHDEPPSFWGNRAIGLKMLECGFAQGSGKAAFELGLTLGNTDEQHARALQILHEGAKLGNEKAANSLSVAFDAGRALVDHRIDAARAERYSILADALGRNPDLRFPNLDKVLPLPPADLPYWDGDKRTLIDAAKPLVALPAVKPTPGAMRSGRAHIPQGHELRQRADTVVVEASAPVPFSGYWLAQLSAHYREHEVNWESAQVPQRYAKGEAFETTDRRSMGVYANVAPRTVWRFMGEPFPLTQVPHPRVAQGIARGTRVPEPLLRCQGLQPCPRTGVWAGELPKEHPLVRLYNRWDRFAYLQEGGRFPDPRDQHIAVTPNEVSWLWLDNANQKSESGIAEVTLSDLHDTQGADEHG